MSNSLFISVAPVGSKFAKALQSAVKEKTSARVFRIHPSRVGTKRSIIRGRAAAFVVTQRPKNKIEQLTLFKENNVSHPPFCTSSAGVEALESKTIFARTLVNSTNGRGIVEFERGSVPPNAPLYTAYIPKKAEYRFHVFNGEVIDVQEKRKKRGIDERNTRIRNVNNGYVYCRDNLTPPTGAAELAVRAVQALGYDYGAVDIVYNEKRNQCYVLEVNSRPGLMGTTVERYADALIKKYSLKAK